MRTLDFTNRLKVGSKNIFLLVLFVFGLAGAVFATEQDNGKFVVSGHEGSASNIYISVEPAKMQFPFMFSSKHKEYSATLTSVGYAFSGEIGYNLSGWLLGVYTGYSKYGNGKKPYSLMNDFHNLLIGGSVSRVITNNTIKSMPAWFEFTPSFGMGVDLIKTDYYPSHRAKSDGRMRNVKFGDVAVIYYHLAFQTNFHLGTDYAIPYASLECNIFSDKIGTAVFSGLSLGVRMYPFAGLRSKTKVSKAEDDTSNKQNGSVSLKMITRKFTPDNDGKKDEAVFKVNTKKLPSSAKSWKLNIFTAEGKLFKTIEGEGVPPNEITWNGKGAKGGAVMPNSLYTSTLEVLLTDGDKISAGTDFKTGEFERTIGVDIRMATENFTPNADGKNDNALLDITKKELIGLADSWKVDIFDPDGDLFRTLSGKGEPPAQIKWNGLGEVGETALSDSVYQADMTVLLKDGQSVKSQDDIKVASFVKKESGAPAIKFGMPPKHFSPDGDGVDDKAIFRFRNNNLTNNAKSWQFKILDPKGKLFKKMGGEGAPPEKIKWDGLDDDGEAVLSAASYKTVMDVTLKNGKKVKSSGSFKTGILVEKQSDGTRRIRLISLYFDPNASTFKKLTSAQRQSNKEGLDAVAKKIKDYPEYVIIVEGHANNTSGTDKENTDYLIPLSQKRADAIAAELIKRGVSRDKISTVGMGGKVPVVPRENKEEWWKNRRVEFILKKK
ncbi:MAG: hypothetical protein CR988_01720 [Treponema sp.]|nr:MAG: hypothetical protein CR988_01720 [Treponema sp.]